MQAERQIDIETVTRTERERLKDEKTERRRRYILNYI